MREDRVASTCGGDIAQSLSEDKLEDGTTRATHEVDIRAFLRAFKVLPLDEVLDPVLDVLLARPEDRELGEDFVDELAMCEHLPRLHDAHDGGVDHDGAIFVDALSWVGAVQRRGGEADAASGRTDGRGEGNRMSKQKNEQTTE